jgi:hypothetical protein
MRNASDSCDLAIGSGTALTGPGQCGRIGLRTCLALFARQNPPCGLQPASEATCGIWHWWVVLRSPGRGLAYSDGAGAFVHISAVGMQRTGQVGEGCAMRECVPSGLELPSGSRVQLSPSLARRGSCGPHYPVVKNVFKLGTRSWLRSPPRRSCIPRYLAPDLCRSRTQRTCQP